MILKSFAMAIICVNIVMTISGAIYDFFSSSLSNLYFLLYVTFSIFGDVICVSFCIF